MISYRMVSSSCCASRLSSAWRRSLERLYVQTLTLTCHSWSSRVMSTDGIGGLRAATECDATDLSARMVGESGGMIEQEADERGDRAFPLASAQLLAHAVHQLLAVHLLPDSDALTQRLLCRRVAPHDLPLRFHDIERGSHHQHR